MPKVMETDPTEKNAAAQALGRLGGAANTPAQQRARKRNAKLAGRPGHVERALDESCGQHGWRWQQGANGAPRLSGGVTLTLASIAAITRRRTLSADERLSQIVAALRAVGL